MDYSDDDTSDSDVPVFFDAKKNAITVKRVNKHCCRPSRATCTKKQTKEGNRVTECKVLLGRTFCDNQKRQRRGINTCSALIKYARAQAAKQKQRRQMDKGDSYVKSKTVTELSKSELEKVVKEITLPQSKGKPNPKCKKKKW